jgi:glycosyltransferase involved in cell wall biosynthesis
MDVGGLERVALDLVRLADPQRFDPRILCLRQAGALAPLAERMGVPVEALGSRGMIDGLPRLVRRLRQLRPAILHTHNPGSQRVGVPARLLSRVPVLVHTKHGRNHPEKALAVAINRWLARYSDQVVAVSEDASRVAVEVERIPEAKVRVIHNGVDLADRLPPSEWQGWSPRGITVSRLDPVKDQVTMLRAVRRVVDECPEFRLEIVGDGPSRASLEEACVELGLTEHVAFLGYRTDVDRLLRRPLVFLLSSVTEGISLTLLEAMAAGLPVVATDVGGNREVVANGITGVLVRPRAPEALAGAVLKLIKAPGQLAAMGAAGRARAEAEFDLKVTARRYYDLYDELARARGLPPSDPRQ